MFTLFFFKELDSDNTFVIDRNPSHEASFLEDFTAPPLRGSDPPGDDIDSDDERRYVLFFDLKTFHLFLV